MSSRVGKNKENAAYLIFGTKEALEYAVRVIKEFKWEGHTTKILTLSEFEDYKLTGRIRSTSPAPTRSKKNQFDNSRLSADDEPSRFPTTRVNERKNSAQSKKQQKGPPTVNLREQFMIHTAKPDIQNNETSEKSNTKYSVGNIREAMDVEKKSKNDLSSQTIIPELESKIQRSEESIHNLSTIVERNNIELSKQLNILAESVHGLVRSNKESATENQRILTMLEFMMTNQQLSMKQPQIQTENQVSPSNDQDKNNCTPTLQDKQGKYAAATSPSKITQQKGTIGQKIIEPKPQNRSTEIPVVSSNETNQPSEEIANENYRVEPSPVKTLTKIETSPSHGSYKLRERKGNKVHRERATLPIEKPSLENKRKNKGDNEENSKRRKRGAETPPEVSNEEE
jgi:hypothetical protein